MSVDMPVGVDMHVSVDMLVGVDIYACDERGRNPRDKLSAETDPAFDCSFAGI